MTDQWPSYSRALRWIVINDDCEWLLNEDWPLVSVTAALVADIFGKTNEQVRAALRMAYRREYGK
jgi:hypothetical protein